MVYFVSDPDIAYLNNRVFLSENYSCPLGNLMFLKVTIYRRSEASWVNILFLRTSNVRINVVAPKKRLKRTKNRGKNSP